MKMKEIKICGIPHQIVDVDYIEGAVCVCVGRN